MARKWLRKSDGTVPLHLNEHLVALVGKLLTMTWGGEFRESAKDFTRAGPLTPELVVTLLLFMASDAGRRGYGLLLDEFWNEAERIGIELPSKDPVSAAAFCKARRKLKPDLLEGMIHMTADAIDEAHGDKLMWNGRRILAVDGMKHNLQRSAKLDECFGTPSGGHCPQMLVSVLFDVIGQFPCSSTLAPGASCERQELLKLIKHLRPGSVVVLDRGYVSFEVIAALVAAGVDWVIRVPKSHTFEAVDVFLQSGGVDYRVLVTPPRDSRNGEKPIEMRAVRIDAGGDDPWILLTSLRRSEVTRAQLGELYHLRWEAEESYKVQKSDYFGQRQFHSKSEHGVLQEHKAQLLVMAIAQLLAANAAAVAEEPVALARISTKASILATASNIVRLVLCDDPEMRRREHHALLRRIGKRVIPHRPGRSYPRVSYKPGPRWNSKGRIGRK